jgi:hypothetical protein
MRIPLPFATTAILSMRASRGEHNRLANSSESAV